MAVDIFSMVGIYFFHEEMSHPYFFGPVARFSNIFRGRLHSRPDHREVDGEGLRRSEGVGGIRRAGLPGTYPEWEINK